MITASDLLPNQHADMTRQDIERLANHLYYQGEWRASDRERILKKECFFLGKDTDITDEEIEAVIAELARIEEEVI